MAADRNDADSTREFRLEGIGLVLGGGFLVALLVGAFFLGRWVERGAHPPAELTADAAGPLAQVAAREPDLDAADGLTHFDTVEGGEKQAELARELAVPTPRPATLPAAERGESGDAASQVAARAEEGRFYVQIVALRDRAAAAEVIRSLERQGYGVRLFSEREGQGTLYKVRVGGYATRDEAGTVRDALRRSDHPGAFLWPAE